MKNKSTNRIQLFIEGREIDLEQGESLKNGITLGLATVQNISAKGSSISKTIDIPGSNNNNQLFNFFFDVKSTVNSNYTLLTTRSIQISNGIPGMTVTGHYVYPLPSWIATSFNPDPNLGFTFNYPIASGSSQTSYHHAIPNTAFAIETSGSASGYVICKLNGAVIATNKVIPGVVTYNFPIGDYLFDDILEINFQTTQQQFSGNIGYAFDPRKKARAYVLSNGQIILSGYAKLISANSKNGQTSYKIQVTSELGGLLGALGNSRLEDLFTREVPDLVNDPLQTLGLTKIIDLPSPYDHQLTLGAINDSFYGFENYVYPLIDYGGNGGTGGGDRSDLTSNSTNFYTSVLRPCIYASDYFSLIMNSVGYIFDGTFLSSSYWQSLICPYKDGNFSNVNTNSVTVTSVGTQSMVVPSQFNGLPLLSTQFYPFNSIVSDQFQLYSTVSESFNPPYLGMYNVSSDLVVNFTVNAPGTDQLKNPITQVLVEYRVFSSGSVTPYTSGSNLFSLDTGSLTFEGVPYFVSNGVNQISDPYNLNFADAPIFLNTGDYLRVNVNPWTNGGFSSTACYFAKVSDGSVVTGSMNVTINTTTQPPSLNIALSTQLDGQWIRYKDFVPKSISCKDYLDSIIKLFNLYPVQDPVKKNHFTFYTRDEFFNGGTKHNWDKKINNDDSDITIKPIPELDAAHLLFSFKKGKDYYNKLYDSLYGNFSYGALRIDTQYQFAHSEKDIMKGLLFEPTPIVQNPNTEYNSEGPIEIINGPDFNGYAADESSTIIMATGYFNANGTVSPYDNMVEYAPTSNNFSGTKFTRARVGVQIQYWNQLYTIKKVYNEYAFQVDRKLVRPFWPDPNNTSTQRRISNNFYATSDGFTYITNNNLAIPQIYESSDGNVTHKPTKTEMKILYFQPINANSSCNTFYLQYTPYLVNGIYTYFNGTAQGTTTNNYLLYNQYPFAHHLNDPRTPTKDLNFAPPIELFYPYSGSYPTKNIYSSYWINTVNEILDPNSKFMEASMKLNSIDISNLSLADTISIQNTNFRVNQIKDFRADESQLTKCEFIRQPISQNTIGSPVVNAGGDFIIDVACIGSISLNGTVMTDDSLGQIVASVLWTETSGSSTIVSSESLSTAITGITLPGTYNYNLAVTDNFGNSANDNVSIQILAHTEINPVVTMLSLTGSITLPVSTYFVSGGIQTFNCTTLSQSIWTETSGSSTITTPTALNSTITGISTAGTYIYKLTGIDNYLGSGSATTLLTVYPAINMNIENHIGGASITGFSGTTLTPAFTPIIGTGTFNTSRAGLSSATIVINTGGSIPPGTFHMNYSRNGSLISNQVASTGATYTFTGVSGSLTDVITFDLST